MRPVVPLIFLLLLQGCAPVGTIRDDNILLLEDSDQGAQSGLAEELLANSHISLARGAGPDGSDAILVEYVGSEHGSKRVLARYPLNRKVDQATLSFDVRFDEDFQWQLGGKLHGLGPVQLVTGGGQRRADGWSARIMFRQGGRCSTYLYEQSRGKKYGVGDTTVAPVFTAGQWHHVVFRIRLNEPGKANGFARILIDDQEVVDTTGVNFRGEGGEHTRIQKFLFSTFHGGNSRKWAPADNDGNPVTVHAWFDNFKVTAN